MIFRKKLILPEKQYPLVLKTKWRTDLLNPRQGRLNALAGRGKHRTPRPLSLAQKARLRRYALTFADIQRVDDLGLHKVPADVREEIEFLRALRDRKAFAAE